MTNLELIQTLAGIIQAQNPEQCAALRSVLLAAQRAQERPVVVAPYSGPAVPPPAPVFNDEPQPVNPDTLTLRALDALVRKTTAGIWYDDKTETYEISTANGRYLADTLREAIEAAIK